MFFIDTLSEVPIYTQICNGIIKEILMFLDSYPIPFTLNIF